MCIFYVSVTYASPLEKKVAKSSKSYFCEYCDYTTSKKFNWEKHLTTQKHIKKRHFSVTGQ